MKRLIKYWSSYNDTQFSDCSTKYEILPVIVEDSAGVDDLKRLAKEQGLVFGTRSKVIEPEKQDYRNNKITHSLKLAETKDREYFGKKEKMFVFVGFITLTNSKYDNEILPVHSGIDKVVTKEQANKIVNEQAFGVDTVVEVSDELMIIMQSWNYYHEMRFQGYDRRSFEKRMGTKERDFSDSVSNCGDCGVWDYQDDGHHYNFRVVGGDHLGVNCGCYKKAAKDNLEEFINNSDKVLDSEIADELESKLIFVEQLVSGMTDAGRYHRFAGRSARVATPGDVLKEYKAKFPKANFVFVLNGSGQFQTYYSIYKVKGQVNKSA